MPSSKGGGIKKSGASPKGKPHGFSRAEDIPPFELIQNQQIPDRQAEAGKKSG